MPPEPLDPTLTTLLSGPGNPKVRYLRSPRNCQPLKRKAGNLRRKSSRLARRAKGGGPKLRAKAKKAATQSRRANIAARRCARSNRSGNKQPAPKRAQLSNNAGSRR